MTRKAKVFWSGRSQAVRLPAEFRLGCKEVLIEKKGDVLVLTPKPSGWADFFERTGSVPADFMTDRRDLAPETRKLF